MRKTIKVVISASRYTTFIRIFIYGDVFYVSMPPVSDNEHRVAVRAEPVVVLQGFLVASHDIFVSSECSY